MRALEKAGYIKVITPISTPRCWLRGDGLRVRRIEQPGRCRSEEFEEQVRGWPMVRECHMLSGEGRFHHQGRGQDLSAFQSFITDTLTAAKMWPA